MPGVNRNATRQGTILFEPHLNNLHRITEVYMKNVIRLPGYRYGSLEASVFYGHQEKKHV